ncbi:DUF4391 domain-containing protein [Agromyces sp. GXS1127]|uniref:DUF4391 domain-containing protein n=1 Tax=Agromyces sp. GXS1127 TaxID=3424181 RepID=UPI003D31A6C7
MTGVLFEWPAGARVDRPLRKVDIYRNADVSSAVRAHFVDDVESMSWTAKLSPSTTRLDGSSQVPEFQVFTIVAKGTDVDAAVLTAIDSVVRYPVIFEIRRGGEVIGETRMTGAQKTLISGAPKVGPHFSTDWVGAHVARQALPAAVDLPALYAAVFSTLLPAAMRPGESVSEATDRLNRSRKLQREINALERRLRTEPQLNRKIELRRQIKERTAVLAELTDPVPSNKE